MYFFSIYSSPLFRRSNTNFCKNKEYIKKFNNLCKPKTGFLSITINDFIQNNGKPI